MALNDTQRKWKEEQQNSKKNESKIVFSKQQAKAFQYLTDSETQEIYYGWAAWGWKIVAEYWKVMTPKGWKVWKDLKEWDSISWADWLPQKIIAITPWMKLPKWRVSFSDWTHTDVAEWHLWTSWRSRKSLNKWWKRFFWKESAQVVETKTLKEWLDKSEGNRWVPLIQVNEEIYFDQSNTYKQDIDPYLLWVLLWDWCITKNKPTITAHIDDTAHILDFVWEEDISIYNTEWRNTNELTFIWERRISLVEKLEKYKLLWTYSNTKFIPDAYKYGSIENRYEIVRWLMDTDWYKRKDTYASYYYTTSPKLAEDMEFILRSLWSVVTTTKRIWKYKKEDWTVVECKEFYTLYIKHKDPDKLFHMERKKKYLPPKEINKRVINVEKLDEDVRWRCITVSNPDWLYITDDFIVTHNSRLGAFWLISNCLKYPWTIWVIGRKELTKAKKTTLVTLFEVLKMLNINTKWYKYDKQMNVMTFANDSKIYIFDLAYEPSDPEYSRLWSFEWTWAFIDEAAEIDKKAVMVLKTRLRKKLDEHWLIPKILLTMNPDKTSFIYRDVYRPWKEWNLDDSKIFIPALAVDNPFLPDVYVETLKNIDDPTLKKRLFDWDWEYIDDPNLLFDQQSLYDMFINEPQRDGKMYITCDVARKGRDKTVIFVWNWMEVIYIEEFADVPNEFKDHPTKYTTELIKRLSVKYKVPKRNILIDENWLWGGIIDALGCKWFINNARAIQPKQARRDDSFTLNYADLKTQCYYKLKEYADLSKIKINCDAIVKNLIIQELEQVKIKDIDNDGKVRLEQKQEMKIRLWRSPDFADALMMRMYYELPIKGKIQFF